MKNNYGYGLPINISTHGAEIDQLINFLHIVMIALFIGWLVFLVYTLFKFRARPGHKAEYHTKHFKLPTYIEVIVAALEMVLLLAFSMPIWVHLHKSAEDPDAMQIRVVAQQFAWNMHYPGKDGVFGKVDAKLMDSSNPVGLDLNDKAAKDDIVTTNQLHIPVDTPIAIQLTSKDVIHSFFLPVMRVKQDAIPGQKVNLSFQADKTGEFEIACAQLCGLGHYRMRGFFTVDSKDNFKKWLTEQAPQ